MHPGHAVTSRKSYFNIILLFMLRSSFRVASFLQVSPSKACVYSGSPSCVPHLGPSQPAWQNHIEVAVFSWYNTINNLCSSYSVIKEPANWPAETCYGWIQRRINSIIHILLHMSAAHTMFLTRERRKYLTLTTHDFMIRHYTLVYISEQRRATILTGHVVLFSGLGRSSYWKFKRLVRNTHKFLQCRLLSRT